jgi:hypothetical protein
MKDLEIREFREIGDYRDRKNCALIAADRYGDIYVLKFQVKGIYAAYVNKAFQRILPFPLRPVKDLRELFTTA